MIFFVTNNSTCLFGGRQGVTNWKISSGVTKRNIEKKIYNFRYLIVLKNIGRLDNNVILVVYSLIDHKRVDYYNAS